MSNLGTSFALVPWTVWQMDFPRVVRPQDQVLPAPPHCLVVDNAEGVWKEEGTEKFLEEACKKVEEPL